MKYMCAPRTLLILLFALLSLKIFAQDEALPIGESVVENTDALTHFKSKIDSLVTGKRQKVRIVHIGDSHLQTDKFTSEIRKELHDKFGNGGRGLIFPYKLAQTTGPRDYECTSNSKWINARNVDFKQKLPVGLAGFTIKSLNDSGAINIKLGYDSIPDYYTKAFIMYSADVGAKIALDNHRVTQPADKKEFDTLSFKSSTPLRNLSIRFAKTNLNFYGAYVENAESGIIYSSMGVIGARYKDYCETPYFWNQLKLLQADLVIVSLGTNESYPSWYTDEDFTNYVNEFIAKVRKACPGADILLTCPSENYHVKNGEPVENTKVAQVNTVLRAIAQKQNLGIWDLFKAMGGNGSMLTWKAHELVNKDYIHFWLNGYKIQGELFSSALLDLLSKK